MTAQRARMESLTLRLPLPPSRNRGNHHWSKVYREKKAWYALADLWTMPTRFPAAPLRAVLASAHIYPWAVNDEDNLMARMKTLQDWCKSRGIVLDDTPACWHWIAVPEQTAQRKEPAYLILTLHPAE